MSDWIVTFVLAGLFVWRIVWGIRENHKHEFLAKLMDCEYVQIGYGDYYIPKN